MRGRQEKVTGVGVKGMLSLSMPAFGMHRDR